LTNFVERIKKNKISVADKLTNCKLPFSPGDFTWAGWQSLLVNVCEECMAFSYWMRKKQIGSQNYLLYLYLLHVDVIAIGCVSLWLALTEGLRYSATSTNC